MEPSEEIRKSTAQQSCAIDRVLQANSRDDAEVRQEVGGQLAREAKWVGTGEHQNAVERVVAPQGNQGNAPSAARSVHEQLVVRGMVGSQPGAIERAQLGRERRHRIHEMHVLLLLGG